MATVVTFFLILVAASPNEVLVLKNGKTMVCDRIERKDNVVTIYRGAQKFTLPEKLIDWERSESESERRAAAELAREAKEKKKAAQPSEPKQKKDIRLTRKQYKKIASPRVSGKTTISYRKFGNTILVQVSVNRGETVDFVLDTGAAVTLISPEAAADWDVAYMEERIQLIGVGGEAIDARHCILKEVNLGGARVANLKAVVRGIPQLNDINVVGLLGQDFLNHFVVNLNSANQTLTLTPHGAGHLIAEQGEQFTALLKDPNKPFLVLNQMAAKLETYYTRFMVLNEPLKNNREINEIKKIVAELPRIRGQIDRLHGALTGISTDQITEDEKSNMQQFLACYPRFGNVMSEISQFSQMLRKAYSNARDEASLRGMQNMLADGWLQTVRSVERFKGCM